MAADNAAMPNGIVLVERKQPKNDEAAEPLLRIVVL
jgi:hypothetical protein